MLQSVAVARVLFASKKASADVLAPVSQNMRAWPWLCDRLGHINNARYLDLLEFGRAQWLADNGLLRSMLWNGYSFLIAGVNAVYRRPIPLMAQFTLETRVAAFDDAWSSFEHTFYLDHDRRGKIAARFIARGALYHRKQRVPALNALRRFGVEAHGAPLASSALDACTAAQQAVLDSIKAHDSPQVY